MLTMSRSKRGVWGLFTRTAMRDGGGSWSSGVFCIVSDQRRRTFCCIEEPCRQELHQSLSRIVLSSL